MNFRTAALMFSEDAVKSGTVIFSCWTAAHGFSNFDYQFMSDEEKAGYKTARECLSDWIDKNGIGETELSEENDNEGVYRIHWGCEADRWKLWIEIRYPEDSIVAALAGADSKTDV